MKTIIIDARKQILGRLAARCAKLLKQGEGITVLNLEAIEQTSKNKIYYRYTGYPGGIKKSVYSDVTPDWAFRKAVLGMLPKNKLRRERIKNLEIKTKGVGQ